MSAQMQRTVITLSALVIAAAIWLTGGAIPPELHDLLLVAAGTVGGAAAIQRPGDTTLTPPATTPTTDSPTSS